MKKIKLLATILLLMTFLTLSVSSVTVYAFDWERATDEVDLKDCVKYIEEEITNKCYNASLESKIEEMYRAIPKDVQLDKKLDDYLQKTIMKNRNNYEKKALYSIYLYDHNNEKEKNYICTQFENGGYAIFNAKTRVIYERTNEGFNPYHKYKDYKCYYGGPFDYAYKTIKGIYDIETNKKLDKEEIKKLENNMIRVKNNDKMQEEEFSEAQNGDIRLSGYNDIGGLHPLGEGNRIDFWVDLIRALYFVQLDKTYCNHDLAYYVVESTYDFRYINFLEFDYGVDALFGVNMYGSCVMVAMGMLLQFYERLNFVNTIPDIISHWDRLYHFETIPANPKNCIPSVDCPDNTVAESLHQNLIKLIHPTAVYSPSLDLGTNYTQAKQGFSSYFNQNPTVTSATCTVRGGGVSALLKTAKDIYMGNPAIISVGTHATVGYGYTIKKYLIFFKQVDEFLVNKGYYEIPNQNEVYVSASTVDNTLVLNYDYDYDF